MTAEVFVHKSMLGQELTHKHLPGVLIYTFIISDISITLSSQVQQTSIIIIEGHNHPSCLVNVYPFNLAVTWKREYHDGVVVTEQWKDVSLELPSFRKRVNQHVPPW